MRGVNDGIGVEFMKSMYLCEDGLYSCSGVFLVGKC